MLLPCTVLMRRRACHACATRQGNIEDWKGREGTPSLYSETIKHQAPCTARNVRQSLLHNIMAFCIVFSTLWLGCLGPAVRYSFLLHTLSATPRCVGQRQSPHATKHETPPSRTSAIRTLINTSRYLNHLIYASSESKQSSFYCNPMYQVTALYRGFRSDLCYVA